MGNSIDILNLEWPQSDRDRHIVTPVYLYLREKYSLSVKTDNIFHGLSAIKKYSPRLLLISNFSGAKINHLTTKQAYNAGIKVVSLISEGNVKENATEQYLWGWNKDKKLYVDKLLVWTERSRNLFLKQHPELEEKIVVTGGTGFDRYKLLNFLSKEKFLKQHVSGNFSRIIGIAAWGFDHFFGDYYERNKKFYLEKFGREQIEMHRGDLFKLQKIYRKLIMNNPDILFILRYHPGTLDYQKNEFFGLEKFKNVFISSRKLNWDLKISDLINVSDLWIGYETTTALEAWLLGKTTFLINPTTADFIRENVASGSPIAMSVDEAQNKIKRFFSLGELREFEDLRPIRDKIIKDTIGFDDGKNHIRAAEEIYKVLISSDREISKVKIPISKILKQNMRYLLKKMSGHPYFKDIQKEVEFYESLYKKNILI